MKSRCIVFVAGNTRTRVALMRGMDVEAEGVPVPTRDLSAAALRASLDTIPAEGVDDVVLCSVVPAADAVVREFCARAGMSCIDVRPSGVRGMTIPYEPPDGLGADRLCGLLGVRARYGAPAMLVDCGTATTCNILDARGDFGGGSIFPGMAASLRALHSHTAMLPAVEPGADVPVFPAFGTLASLRAGAYWSAVWAVEGMIRRARALHGEALRVVMTGGGSAALRPALGAEIIEDQQVLFVGAAVYRGG